MHRKSVSRSCEGYLSCSQYLGQMDYLLAQFLNQPLQQLRSGCSSSNKDWSCGCFILCLQVSNRGDVFPFLFFCIYTYRSGKHLGFTNNHIQSYFSSQFKEGKDVWFFVACGGRRRMLLDSAEFILSDLRIHFNTTCNVLGPGPSPGYFCTDH